MKYDLTILSFFGQVDQIDIFSGDLLVESDDVFSGGFEVTGGIHGSSDIDIITEGGVSRFINVGNLFK